MEVAMTGDPYGALTPDEREALRRRIDEALQTVETIDFAFYDEKPDIDDIPWFPSGV
jgi:hypothetical protein